MHLFSIISLLFNMCNSIYYIAKFNDWFELRQLI